MAIAFVAAIPIAGAGEAERLTREVWSAVEGSDLKSLVDLPRFHGGPDAVSLVDSAAAPQNAGDHYGSRLRGHVIAPVTGDYTFWESGDDAVELWLSTSADKFGATRIAHHAGWTDPFSWDKYGTQKSGLVRLAAGQKYYIELRHKEGGGGDHAAMAWSYKEVQSSLNLARLPGTVATQSSVYGTSTADLAIDGATGGDVSGGDLITHTQDEPGAWWQVDLGGLRSIDRLVIWNREGYNGLRLANFRIDLLDPTGAPVVSKNFHTDGTHAGDKLEWELEGALNARIVKIQLLGPSGNGEQILSLAEVEVLGVESPHTPSTGNLARGSAAVATQAGTYGTWHAANAIDGDLSGDTAAGAKLAHTQNTPGAWWQVDLGASHYLERVAVWNREGYNQLRLSNFRMLLLDDNGAEVLHEDFHTDGTHAGRSFEWILPARARARTVKIQLLGPSANGEQIINVAEVEVFGESNRLKSAARQLIPAAHLESFDPQANDLDDDDLLDAWELAYGFNPATWQAGDHAWLADPDGDYIPNHQECAYGLDPFAAGSLPGHLTHEQWFHLPYGSLREATVAANKYYLAADKIRMVAESGTGLHELDAIGQRLRGYIEAPVTGDYHFWISATNGAQLLLSSGSDKYHKRVIAEMGHEVGTGYGVYYYSAAKWDSFATQMSEPVHLVAGQKYFLELRHQHQHSHYPHASIAWAVPGGERGLIPAQHLSSYHPLPEDSDDDSLPDAWETAHGLSATDNGLLGRFTEGENGDLDGDGLTNREEYLAGTDPAEPDSDGDGLSDRDEIRTYGTNPTVSDAAPEQVVQSVSPASVSGAGGAWVTTADGAMISSFRGSGSWNFEVPSDGFWVIHVEAKLRGNLRAEEILPVNVKIDSKQVTREDLTFINGLPGSLRIITPWLSAGSHQVELFFDNYMARRVPEVTAVKVIRPGGMDGNGDGRSDAVVGKLKELNRILPEAVVESWISPVFIEGSGRSPGEIEFRYLHAGAGSFSRRTDAFWNSEIPGLQTSARSLADGLALAPAGSRAGAGSSFATTEGPGHDTWFAKIPLAANEAATYSIFFENGAIADSGVVVWRPLNAFEVQEVTIPVGSTLLMSAWTGDTDDSKVLVTHAGSSQEILALDSVSRAFPEAGDFEITLLHEDSGLALALVVHVKDAALPAGVTLEENRHRTVLMPAVAPGLFLDARHGVAAGPLQAVATGGSKSRLSGVIPGVTRLAARMGAQEAILDQKPVTVVGLSDALRNQTITATSAGDGLLSVRSPLLVTGLPPGATVRIGIFAGGVTFPDGTTVKVLTAEDFDENGIYLLELVMPKERLGAPCHTIEIFDAEGKPLIQ